MNNEERELINQFFNRVGGESPARAGSVPSTSSSLPPVDPEADQFIAENFKKYPEAAYRVTQMAVIQEAALVEAHNRLRQLEWELHQTKQQLQQAQQTQPFVPQNQPGSGGSFLGGLFGRNRQQTPPQQMPPGWGGNRPSSAPLFGGQPQGNYAPPSPAAYPPGYQQGMFNRGGSGFLGSAMATAAGVAGGMMMGHALTNLFSGGNQGTASSLGDVATGGAFSGGSEAINDPFSGSGTSVDPNFDAGSDNSASFDQGGSDAGWGGDSSSTDDGFDGGGDWGGDDGGGWDDNNSGF